MKELVKKVGSSIVYTLLIIGALFGAFTIVGMLIHDAFEYVIKHDFLTRPFFYPFICVGTITVISFLFWLFSWVSYNKK